MAKVTVSKTARNDLVQIRVYIRDELSNPDAARRIINMLRQNIEKLADMPERGKPLDTVLGVHTGYRFLACENYRAFYLFLIRRKSCVCCIH